MNIRQALPILLAALCLPSIGAANDDSFIPADGADVGEQLFSLNVSGEPAEAWNTGWSFTFDNDVLARRDWDRDYTGGVSVELSGARASAYRFSAGHALEWINDKLDRNGTSEDLPSSNAIQFGVLMFTPEDFRNKVAQAGDRPYANLVFLSNSRFELDSGSRRAYQTSFTVGVLGSGFGEALQRAAHRVSASATPVGYGRQISDGGEFTARYSFSRQSLLRSRTGAQGRSFQLKYAVGGSVGYLTEGSGTIAVRWGTASSRWWEFAPTLNNYVPAPNPRMNGYNNRSRESYFWASATLRAKAYDAFLQGQFRSSRVTYANDDINQMVGELSIGWTVKLSRELTLSQSVHYQTQQVRRGVAARDHAWGSFSVARNF